jgi:hypothetical protein
MNLIIKKNINNKIFNLYDFDTEKPYKPGGFNQRYKTNINDKIQIIQQQVLNTNVIDSFLNGHYSTVITIKGFYLYRLYGEYICKDGTIKGAKLLGGFATTEFAESTIDAKIRLALDPQWLNTKMYEIKIAIPEGITLNIGKIAPITTLSGFVFEGGADQVLLPRNWPKSWIVGYRRVSLNQLLDTPKYSMEDPSQKDDKFTIYPHSCPLCNSINTIKLAKNDEIKYKGSKGNNFIAHNKCLDCLLYW